MRANPIRNLAVGSNHSPHRHEQRLRIRELDEQLQQLRTATMCAMNQLLDLKDLSTGTHSTRLAEWAVRVAEQLGSSQAELHDIEQAAILHDVGKIGVPDAILNKPGKLTPEERTEIEKHSEHGWSVLRMIPGFEKTSLLVLYHHEKADGTGYPARLKREETPLGSRIVGVIDSFDAMVSDRCYRKGLPIEEAVRRLRADCGTHFDPEIVELFIPIALKEYTVVTQTASNTPQHLESLQQK